jgi:hypothetical protein
MRNMNKSDKVSNVIPFPLRRPQPDAAPTRSGAIGPGLVVLEAWLGVWCALAGVRRPVEPAPAAERGTKVAR